MKTSVIWTALALLAGLAAAALLATGPARATEDLARSTALTCTACHDKPGSRLLTDRGKYFEHMRTMDGFDQVIENFGSCTYCHRAKPGSKRLTREGKRLSGMTGDMAALKTWLEDHHPARPDAAQTAPAGPRAGEKD